MIQPTIKQAEVETDEFPLEFLEDYGHEAFILGLREKQKDAADVIMALQERIAFLTDYISILDAAVEITNKAHQEIEAGTFAKAKQPEPLSQEDTPVQHRAPF